MLSLRPPSSTGGRYSPALPEPLPVHWRNAFPKSWPWIRPWLKVCFSLLCLLSLGHSDLQNAWMSIRGSEQEFTVYADRIANRISTVTIIAGLLLGSVTTLITATPPRPDILDFTKRAPQLLLWAAFGDLVGGVYVGFFLLFVLQTTTREWTINVLAASRFRIWSLLLLIAYPFISIGVACLLSISGLLIAELTSDDIVVQAGSVFFFIIPGSLFVLVFFIGRPPRKAVEESLPHAHTGDASKEGEQDS